MRILRRRWRLLLIVGLVMAAAAPAWLPTSPLVEASVSVTADPAGIGLEGLEGIVRRREILAEVIRRTGLRMSPQRLGVRLKLLVTDDTAHLSLRVRGATMGRAAITALAEATVRELQSVVQDRLAALQRRRAELRQTLDALSAQGAATLEADARPIALARLDEADRKVKLWVDSVANLQRDLDRENGILTQVGPIETGGIRVVSLSPWPMSVQRVMVAGMLAGLVGLVAVACAEHAKANRPDG